MKLKKLLAKICALIKSILYRKRYSVSDEFQSDLYADAMQFAIEELEKERMFGNELDQMIEKTERGEDLTDEEARSIGLIKI